MIITEHPIPSAEESLASDRALFPFLCCRAILGGTIAAIGIHLLLAALGVGAGLATFTPMNDTNPVANLSIGAAIVWTLCALVAVSFGGFVAGRFSHWYNAFKAELDKSKVPAELKAREASDRAAGNLSCAALWSFFALLAGLLFAAISGSCGASCALLRMNSRQVPLKQRDQIPNPAISAP